MKAVILALILVAAVLMARGITQHEPITFAGGLIAAPSLLYLLLVAIPRAERAVNDMLKDEE